MTTSELRKLIREEVRKSIQEEQKSDLSGILFSISTLLDSLDDEQLSNYSGLDTKNSKLLRKSIDTMMGAMDKIGHLIDVQKLR
jgi:hypothetical protein